MRAEKISVMWFQFCVIDAPEHDDDYHVTDNMYIHSQSHADGDDDDVVDDGEHDDSGCIVLHH